jgi:hypothetical protein
MALVQLASSEEAVAALVKFQNHHLNSGNIIFTCGRKMALVELKDSRDLSRQLPNYQFKLLPHPSGRWI